MHKSLYIWLTALLGVLLFFIIHRAVVLLYWWLIYIDFPTYGLGLSPIQLLIGEWVSGFVFLFVGGWYGVWVGLSWYELVYVRHGGKGFFYAFWGKHNPAYVPIPPDLSLTPHEDWPMPTPVSAREVHIPAPFIGKAPVVPSASQRSTTVVTRSMNSKAVRKTAVRSVKSSAGNKGAKKIV